MPGRIFVDIAPLRDSRQFRLLFSGQLVTTLGSNLTIVAIPYQVYSQTHSSLQVGAISLVQLVPMVIGSLIGGSVGDAVDRRKLILYTSGLLTLASGALAVNAAVAHPSLLALYLISMVAAALTGFINPARNAVIPSLVSPAHLVAAYAFTQVVYQVGSIVGPAISGLLIDGIGLAWVYGIDAISFLLSVLTIARMTALPPAAGAARPGFASIVEGLRYMRGRPALQGVFLIDINAMVFGMPRALFPALSENVFHGGATTLGYLYAAPGVGALLGALTTGWVARIRRQGWAVIIAVLAWGAAIAVFGFVHTLWVALVLLAIAGWADVISAVLRNTILQTSIPDQFRSRLSSIQMAVVQGGPRLGDMESGTVAALVSTEFSIVSGGIACIIGAVVLARLLPAFRRYDTGAESGGPETQSSELDDPGGAGPGTSGSSSGSGE